MARRPRDARLETRDARARLASSTKPYWRQLHPGLAVGYRKGKRKRNWVMRRRREASEAGTAPYVEHVLGLADDFEDADGVEILNYGQAVKAALRMADSQQRERLAMRHEQATYTVEDCLEDYAIKLEATSKNPNDHMGRLRLHVLPAFGARPVEELTTAELERWLHRLAKKGTKATANRVLRAFKAALNYAYRMDRVASDAAWRRVTPFRNADGKRTAYLTEAEARRLLNACEPDFRQLVRAALLTGARYAELIATEVRDFDPAAGTLLLRDTKADKPRYVPLSDEGVDWFRQWTAGRRRRERIFTRADGSPWGKSHQTRRMKDACARAGLGEEISFHILRHTYGSLLALRGVPLAFIAQAMGHADTRMTEKHYAHLQRGDAVTQAIRRNMPSYGTTDRKVATL